MKAIYKVIIILSIILFIFTAYILFDIYSPTGIGAKKETLNYNDNKLIFDYTKKGYNVYVNDNEFYYVPIEKVVYIYDVEDINKNKLTIKKYTACVGSQTTTAVINLYIKIGVA